ncbi:MAG: protein kinase [Candidatus Krumholzibacteriia bacterium]
MQCPTCSAPVTSEQRFCQDCGTLLEEMRLANEETLLTGTTPNRPAPASRSQISSSSSASWLSAAGSVNGGFASGTMLLGRYRIVGLLGTGGMGEVYRADDLTLGQAVALKFLPLELVSDPDRLARFHGEVRIARQVSHPNVCRVHDIGDLGGRPFLSMELVDGEDLASLLRRIGRLPRDKATELGRQICAGLAAAHNAGVLHRDLKPGNIMIDANGKVRLTDFGLAVLAEHADRGEGRAGTPAYMSPEQLQGREVTTQSDIYALGLVLYEMLTGKRPYKADTLAELSERRSQAPASPSSLVEGIDPALERAILRCLETDPARRPQSAIAVAASLLGGDPLAAALEAGETPSPEMVAAAGEQGTLRTLVAWGLLSLVGVMLAALVAVSSRYYLVNHVPMPKPPAVLEDRAMDIVRTLGYTDAPADRETGFTIDSAYIDHVTRHDSTLSRWETLRRGEPPAVLFWYRQSPQHMRVLERFASFSVTYGNPPPLLPGMVRLLLDPSGRLVHFHAVPEHTDSSRVASEPIPASVLFERAGLDLERFESARPVRVPPVFCDARMAWKGTYAGQPDSIGVEMGFHRGRPVSFEIVGPWTLTTPMRPAEDGRVEKVAAFITALLILALLLGSALQAREHLRHGRGDRAGATRLAAFIFGLYFIVWVFTANHASSLTREFSQFIPALAFMVFISSLFWVIYIALEPYMRRQWPHLIISWTRLLSGRFRDPLVGRDLLVGVLFGAVFTLWDSLEHFVPGWLGLAPRVPERTSMMSLFGVLPATVRALAVLAGTMFGPLALVFLLLGLRRLLRQKWLAVAVIVAIFGFTSGSLGGGGGAHAHLSIPLALLQMGAWMYVVLRFGLLAVIALGFISSLLDGSPITSDLSLWYAGGGAVAVVVTLALALFGFSNALGGRRMAGRIPMQD